MIENPQLAQSYILLSVLRQERDRLLSKTKSIPNLHSQINQMQYILSDRIHKNTQQNNHRKQILQQLQQQLAEKLSIKKSDKSHAEVLILELRKNMNSIRRMSVEGLQLKKQIERDQHQIQELIEQIKKQEQKIKQQQNKTNSIKTTRSMLRQQVEIGKSRVKNLFEIYNQLRNQAAEQLSTSLCIQQQISLHSNELNSLEFQSSNISNKLYNAKIEIYQHEQQLEEKKLKIQNLSQTLALIQRTNDPLYRESCKLTDEIISLQEKLEKALINCQQMNGQFVTISAQANNLQRDNKLTAHKIQCVLMLVKRLHGFRDRLIVLRRNNLKKPVNQSRASDRGYFSKRSRAHIGSEVSIDLNNASQIRQNQGTALNECIRSYEHLK